MVIPGAARDEVLASLGPPHHESRDADRRRIDAYDHVVGDDPQPGEAVAVALYDVATLGLWELIGPAFGDTKTPERQRLVIQYDASDRIESVERYSLTDP